jgi:hypothetical protein
MKRIINYQIRFLVGTIAMWLVGSIIFGANLTIYGVTHIIRMATYIQGAFLIITGVGFPVETLGLVRDYIEVAIGYGKEYKVLVLTSPKITMTEALQRAHKLFTEDVIVGSDKDKYIQEQTVDVIAVGAAIKYPINGDAQPGQDLTHIFHQDHLRELLEKTPEWEETTYAKTWKKPDGSPGIASTVTLEAETVEEVT